MDNKVLVGIVMGSDSDLEIMKETTKTLEEFGIEYELNIISLIARLKKLTNML
jgi:5-(carboxyamino)imidazole ribonucleotide mutase